MRLADGRGSLERRVAPRQDLPATGGFCLPGHGRWWRATGEALDPAD
jgi:hypothetical protein